MTPGITVTDYFDKFVNVILGMGVSFELRVLIMLVMLGIATPGFPLRHSRYAILTIVIFAAVITPTMDPFNLMLVGPVCALFFVGIAAGYLVKLRREGRGISKKALVGIGIACLAATGYWWYARSGRPVDGPLAVPGP